MDLLGGGILFSFSYESVQDSDGGHKEWHIYLQARWFDKDSYSELLQHAGWGASGEAVLHPSLLYYIYTDGARNENVNMFGCDILIALQKKQQPGIKYKKRS